MNNFQKNTSMRTTDEIARIINNHTQAIIDNISYESIEVYNFLRKEYEKKNITDNYLFQFVYRSFYRLDNAGLPAEFKTEYFNLLERYSKPNHFFDFHTILKKLNDIENYKKQRTIQFSFVSKMQNTIHSNKPIYDSKVAKVFAFSRAKPVLSFDEKVDFYKKQLQEIEDTYKLLIKNNSIQKVITLFDEKFQGNNLGTTKKLDFIFWSAGKLDWEENSIGFQ